MPADRFGGGSDGIGKSSIRSWPRLLFTSFVTLRGTSSTTVRDNYNLKSHNTCAYKTYRPDTKSNPNPNANRNPATKQHTILHIQLNIVTFSMY